MVQKGFRLNKICLTYTECEEQMKMLLLLSVKASFYKLCPSELASKQSMPGKKIGKYYFPCYFLNKWDRKSRKRYQFGCLLV